MKCYVLKCKNETALARVRQHCNYYKFKYRTIQKSVVIFSKPVKNWSDVEVIEVKETVDALGNYCYLKV